MPANDLQNIVRTVHGNEEVCHGTWKFGWFTSVQKVLSKTFHVH